MTAIDRMSEEEAARYAAYWGQTEKENAWKRYQAKKAAEGKPTMDYDQWARNYDNLATARAAKREKVEANIAESKAARESSNFAEYAALERDVIEGVAARKERESNQNEERNEAYTGGRTVEELETLAKDPANANSQREIDTEGKRGS